MGCSGLSSKPAPQAFSLPVSSVLTHVLISFYFRYSSAGPCHLNRSVWCCGCDFTGRIGYQLLKAKETGTRLRGTTEYVTDLEIFVTIF